jgi:hypothetical protein
VNLPLRTKKVASKSQAIKNETKKRPPTKKTPLHTRAKEKTTKSKSSIPVASSGARSNCVYSGSVPKDDVPGHDLTGWRKETYKRASGATKGTTDSYWFTPHLNMRLRSRAEIVRFFEALPQCHGDEAEAARRATRKK